MMGRKIIKYLLIFVLVQLSQSSAFCLSDTITTPIDTIFCVNIGDTITLKSDLDTAQYDFIWVKKNMPLDTISFSNQVILTKADTIIRTSIPRDTILPLIIDTITVRFHYPPNIALDIPSIECYNGMALILVSNSDFDATYVTEQITFFNNLDVELPDIPFIKNGGVYSITLNNGDSVRVVLSYEISGCSTIDTSFVIGTSRLPILNFTSDLVCFGDSTTILNSSNFDKQLSDVTISIEGISPDFTTKDNFKCYLDTNGATRSMQVSINQLGCIQTGAYTISNLLKPVGNFSFDKTCENEKLVIRNLSTATTGNFSVQVNIANKDFNFGSAPTINIPDTIPDGIFNAQIKIINNNGCSDSSIYSVSIDPVTYVSFMGLEPNYCEMQDSSDLIGSQMGGTFDGLFVENTTAGRAIFKPEFDTTNIVVKYSFTNGFGCKDSTSQLVNNVFPLPILVLSGLGQAYCEKDDPVTLSINQNIFANSTFTEIRNGIEINEMTGLTYSFNPILPGTYKIVNFYTDSNGCFSEVENTTIVNPLPMISLEPLLILTPGNTIVVGNAFLNEPQVIYAWSNGDNGSSTSLSQPGLYFLTALNTVTTCMKSDSIEIKYDKDIKEDLFNISIYPNPTTNKINIELGSSKTNIKIFKLNGNLVSLNGNTSFSTDFFGKLVLDFDGLEAGYYCIKIPDVGDFFFLKI
jgi:Secretion system C-terminal sorting domain